MVFNRECSRSASVREREPDPRWLAIIENEAGFDKLSPRNARKKKNVHLTSKQHQNGCDC